MTPQVKAQELVLKYLRLQEPNYNWFHKGLAKQCAIIAVDEICKELVLQSVNHEYLDRIQFYCEVKHEIEKL